MQNAVGSWCWGHVVNLRPDAARDLNCAYIMVKQCVWCRITFIKSEKSNAQSLFCVARKSMCANYCLWHIPNRAWCNCGWPQMINFISESRLNTEFHGSASFPFECCFKARTRLMQIQATAGYMHFLWDAHVCSMIILISLSAAWT